jgi:hypothetical protein
MAALKHQIGAALGRRLADELVAACRRSRAGGS